jgi:hypothetical protein
MTEANEHERAPATRKPVCRLVGGDGNVFAVIGSVRRALKNAGQVDRAKEFVARAYHAQGYDEVLAMVHEYVEVR